ncbi:NO-inducible flavohemoprotein [Alkalicoccus chagannorensis]|uniref:NO-inducible flavohemoprotein n=1 Tax=Alkalicoccus chagannorensis TaxID=427072 RepID=UPI000414D056|nr:NO-inducible flavohemoprotein [Alkalicoccus chagannorensis]
MLTEEHKQTIKATIPVLEEHGVTVTTHFYETMFEAHPELLHIFNHVHQKTGMQPQALAYSLYQAAVHIDDLEAILPFVKRVAHKHRSIGVLPEHYPIVGKYLLQAMQDKLNLAEDDPVIEAWGAAYQIIADIFIQIEKEMYEAAAWEGFEELEVVEKVQESSEITSFYLRRQQEQPMPAFAPGQYLSIKAEIDGEPYTHIRQYSLSDAPGQEHFRISVKKEEGPAGMVSTWLHEHVEPGQMLPVSAPAGDFTIDNEKRPAAFLAGGVGITPLMSMIKEQQARQPDRPLTLVHAVRTEEAAALTNEPAADTLAGSFLVAETPVDPEAVDAVGRLTPELLEQFLPADTADVYLCGPEAFMEAAAGLLLGRGFTTDQIHYEYFGPGTALRAMTIES